MSRVVTALLLIAGVIHLLPLPGLLGPAQLARLYGVTIDDPNLALLLRHRAVLFGLLGALLVAAAFRTELRTLAIAAGLISAVSFAMLAWQGGALNSQIARVVVADLIAIACLLAAAAMQWLRIR